MSNNSVKIEVGFRGTITGLTRSMNHQRATITMKNDAGRTLASTTLVGNGENVPMTQEVNETMRAWSFGPFKDSMTVSIQVEHSQTGESFSPSKAILPVTVRKEPDASYPQTYVVSTLLSEDSNDNDYNDCIISIFQYK
ncbi:hypothetical protein D9615_003309 [Tricholomella constricta]|uniref:Uncharacterized protein n=1 Tax=Tricholomella constricta TaxID=117010 RepID=A0A8H5HJ46_9AGAR|nr:hypothetical protein D9615_003309 [Tricholomella constricta]